MTADVKPAVEAVQITVYRPVMTGGKRRRWFSRDAAYRSAALCVVRAACDGRHDQPYWERYGEKCRYCERTCAGRRGVKHCDGYDSSCEANPEHSYRYQLVARLARWLKWRDGRLVQEGRS